MNDRIVWRLVRGIAASIAMCAFAACGTGTRATPAPPPPLDVEVATVSERDVAVSSEWIATLDGYVNAQIRPQVSGYLVTRNYREGASVRKGDVLFEIDPRPFNAVLDQARAQVAQAEAQLAKSARDVERDTPLAEQQAIAQSQLDAETQAYRAAQANVQSLKAGAEAAALNVEFTRVTSLIDGIAAIATAQIGDLVGPATLLTTVSQVSPIKAYFSVSESEYLGMARSINAPHSDGEQPWDARAGLSLTLSDGHRFEHQGRFVAADREVDRGTGTIRLVAAFANPGNVLRPGQYGRVRAVTNRSSRALVVPQRAVADLQGGYQIKVLGVNNEVVVRSITVGDRVGNLQVVKDGVKAGEQVIVGAPAAVREGSIVSPRPFTETGAERVARFFVDRPIVAMVIAIITVIIGVVSMRGLPEAQFPEIVPPQILVTTTYPGADAITMEQAVASPIEQQMNGVDNMLYMQSTNANDNTTQLTVTFDSDTDVNTDQVNVQNRLAEAQANLPPEVNQFGSTIRQSTGLPLLAVALYSPRHSHDSLFLGNYARIAIVDSLLRVPGVGQVAIFGTADYAMRIWVRPDLLAKLGLTVPDLSNAVRQQSTVNPAGQLGASPATASQETTFTVRTEGRLETAEEFGRIVVRASPDGTVVRLQDVARVELGGLSYRQIGRYNGHPSSVIAIFQAPGSNAVQVANSVKQLMAARKQTFPDDVDYADALDSSLPVTEGIREIVKTLAEAVALVMLVVFLFLQSWRATLIPMLAVPVSLIGTFAAFPLLGFSINTLSLFGLVLAVGLVVDDAIVVVEAVQHHIELGLAPRDATLQAMHEVSGPVVSIALILAAVFVPVGLMGGIQGRLNKQFAVTIAIAMLVSAFNALTLTPALSAMLLRPSAGATGLLQRFYAWFNRGLTAATRGYVRVSHLLVRKAAIGIAALLLFGAGDYLLVKRLPTGFVPEEDYGYFLVNVQLPPAASLARTDETCRRIEQILNESQSVAGVATIAGFSLISRVSADNTAFYFVALKPWEERRDAAQQAGALVAQLNTRLMTQIPDAFAFAFMPPAIPGLGNSGGFSFWLQDRGGRSVEYLDKNVRTFIEAARKRPELAGVATIFSASDPQVYANVDRDKSLKQGVPVGDVYQTLQAFLGGLYVNQFNRFGRQWRVFMQADSDARMASDDIGRYYVRNGDRAMVPLSALVTLSKVYGPAYTTRFNLYRAVQLLGGAAPGYSSGQALDALEEVAKATLPPDMGYEFADLSYQERKASGTITGTFALSLGFVFLILAGLYESWSLPLSVLLSVPISIFGAFIGLYLRRFDLDVFAQIGLVMLIGLAAKNAILIVEFSKDRLEAGSSLVDAALEGARVRLRPILMTSFAFILGTVPLWVATGSGGASRRVLGTVVITGMLAATAIAIFVIPMLFVLMERLAASQGAAARSDGARAERWERVR